MKNCRFKVNRIYGIIVLASIMSGCSKDRLSIFENDEILFNVGYHSTKADSSPFSEGDSFSLFAVEYVDGEQMPLQVGGNFINNEKVSFDGTAWKGSRKLFWSELACDFYAFSPYQGNVSTIESYPFTIATDQRNDGYKASDFLFAYTEKVIKSEGGVSIKFKHLMSKLVVNLIKGSAFEGEIPSDVITHIYNTNVECTINLSSGTIEKNSFGSYKTITMKKISDTRFEAIVIPQNIERKTPLVEITMGGIAYLLESSISLRPGYVHTIDVILNSSPEQEQIEISIEPSHNDWE